MLIWDTSPLHHAIRAGKIEILGDIAVNTHGGARRNITTQAVISELGRYSLSLTGTEWLEVVHVDDLVDAMIDTDARYPFQRGGFIEWAKQHGLL